MLEPTVERHGDDFTFTWSPHDVVIVVSRVREHSDGAHAEVTVSLAAHEIHWSRLNLAASPTRAQLAKSLDAEAPEIPWRPMLERACSETARTIRRGSPTTPLRARQATGPMYLVEPILPLGDTAVLFADGGSGKGWLAGTLGLTTTNGLTLPTGIRFAAGRPSGVLYLDWESTQADLEDRVFLLSRGLGCDAEGLHYRRMDRALADDAAAIRADVSRLGVGLVIVDSLAPACGPEPEGADAVTRTFNMLRSLGPGVTRAVIAHVSKAAAIDRGPAKPYGSAFVWNLARSVWEIRRSEDEPDDLVIGLYHRKANRGRLHPSIGLRFTFTSDAVSLAAADLAGAGDLMDKERLPKRVRTVLTTGALTTAELADALGKSEDTVGRTLRRMEGRGVTRLPNTHPTKWGVSL